MRGILASSSVRVKLNKYTESNLDFVFHRRALINHLNDSRQAPSKRAYRPCGYWNGLVRFNLPGVSGVSDVSVI
jgi:hypothetical protein